MLNTKTIPAKSATGTPELGYLFCCLLFSSSFPLAADLCPAGELAQLFGKVFQRTGNIDVLGTHLRTLSAADAGGRFFIIGHEFNPHGNIDRRREPEFVIGADETGDIQSRRAAVAAVTAGGAGNGILHALRNIQQQGSFCFRKGLFD